MRFVLPRPGRPAAAIPVGGGVFPLPPLVSGASSSPAAGAYILECAEEAVVWESDAVPGEGWHFMDMTGVAPGSESDVIGAFAYDRPDLDGRLRDMAGGPFETRGWGDGPWLHVLYVVNMCPGEGESCCTVRCPEGALSLRRDVSGPDMAAVDRARIAGWDPDDWAVKAVWEADALNHNIECDILNGKLDEFTEMSPVLSAEMGTERSLAAWISFWGWHRRGDLLGGHLSAHGSHEMQPWGEAHAPLGREASAYFLAGVWEDATDEDGDVIWRGNDEAGAEPPYGLLPARSDGAWDPDGTAPDKEWEHAFDRMVVPGTAAEANAGRPSGMAGGTLKRIPDGKSRFLAELVPAQRRAAGGMPVEELAIKTEWLRRAMTKWSVPVHVGLMACCPDEVVYGPALKQLAAWGDSVELEPDRARSCAAPDVMAAWTHMGAEESPAENRDGSGRALPFHERTFPWSRWHVRDSNTYFTLEWDLTDADTAAPIALDMLVTGPGGYSLRDNTMAPAGWDGRMRVSLPGATAEGEYSCMLTLTDSKGPVTGKATARLADDMEYAHELLVWDGAEPDWDAWERSRDAAWLLAGPHPGLSRKEDWEGVPKFRAVYAEEEPADMPGWRKYALDGLWVSVSEVWADDIAPGTGPIGAAWTRDLADPALLGLRPARKEEPIGSLVVAKCPWRLADTAPGPVWTLKNATTGKSRERHERFGVWALSEKGVYDLTFRLDGPAGERAVSERAVVTAV